MKSFPSVLARVATVVLCLAFLGAIVLPCFCTVEGLTSHGHCGSQEGLKLKNSSCCCGGSGAGVLSATAKVIPPPPGASMASAVAVSPASFAILRGVLTASAGRPTHGPPVPLVLRI